MIALRATLFNLMFYGMNAILCVVCIPFIFAPRETAFDFIGFYVRCIYWLEKHILGLDYEVRGREYLPANAPYIVAAKHQSAYETFKLHILWRDPAVILKRELIRIPLWGKFLARSEPIAINRTNVRQALREITEGAKKVKEQGRVLVVFPQGTRTWPHETTDDKPYRIGVTQIREATGLPVIPMALNSGMFWPRKGWIKKPGKVVFEFLAPVPPELDSKAALHDLETRLEAATLKLQSKAAESVKP